MITLRTTLRFLGLALIAVSAAGFDIKPKDGCIRSLDGCLVCVANGGACTAEICPGRPVDHNCF